MNPVDNQNPENRHLLARSGERVSFMPLLWSMLHQRETRAELMTLTPQRATELYEDYRAGRLADVQRVWDELEMFDEDLAVVVDKRQRALDAMPWAIEVDAQAVGDDAALAALAEAQQACLQARFNAVENLREAVTYLGMADFHGVAALELTGSVEAGRMRWEVIEPWLLTRPSRRGPWFYNAEADRNATTVDELDREAVIIREARPISLPAMFLIVAKQHAISGWDNFLDTCGNPSIFVELPPGTSTQAAAEMDALVKAIVADGRGTIPSGSKFTTVETTQNNCAAFQERARWCQQAIITLGTGGQLTVMSAPGSGTLAGGAHQNSFEGLMAGTAASISAAINRQFSRRVLADAFPGQPMLVKFSLAPEPQDETAAKAELLGKLSAAGYEMESDAAASELVNLPIRRGPQTAPGMGGMPSPIANSAADADPQTAKLPRPPEPPEPEGGWEDEEEDPYADNPGWDEPEDIANRQQESPVEDDAPLTEDELAAFHALATPNLARMNQRRAEVEARLRAAADLNGNQVEGPIANSKAMSLTECGKVNPMDCRYHGGKLKSPKTWKPIYKPDLITPSEAREKLSKGVKVRNPLGEDITLDGRILEHWDGADKTQKDINERLSLLPLIEEVVKSPAEIWENDNGSHTYLASYINMNEAGKKYTVAFTRMQDHTVIETYYANERVTSNKRKGKLLYSQS